MPRSRLLVPLVALALGLCLAPLAVAAPGSPDTRFGNNGSYDYAIGTASGPSAVTPFPQADGSTLLVGGANGPVLPGQDRASELAVAKITATGARDSDFGTAGVAWLPPHLGTNYVGAIALPGGDLVVLATYADGGNGDTAYTLTRVNPDGTVDTGFGTNGTVKTRYTAFTSDTCSSSSTACRVEARAIARAGTDHIVVAVAWSTTPMAVGMNRAVARYDLDGDLDLNFGDNDGTAELPPLPANHTSLGLVRKIAVEPSGRVVVAEEASLNDEHVSWKDRALVSRLDDDGAVDTSFGDDGIAAVRYEPSRAAVSERAYGLALLPGGDIAVAGESSDVTQSPSHYAGAVAKLDASGDPVTGFGTNGVAAVDRGPGMATFYELTVVGGELYAGGTFAPYDTNGNRTDWWRAWLARFDATGVDETFGQDGSALGGYTNDVSGLAAGADGFMTLTGAYGSSSSASWAVSRLDLAESRQPINGEAPTISSDSVTVQTGDVITSTDGTWHYDDALSRQWQRCPDWRNGEIPAATGCTDITGATGSTYTVQAADAGKHLRLVVRATSGTYVATAATRTIEFVEPTDPVAFTTDPSVTPTGTVPAGTTISATWQATGTAPITAEVDWYSCPSATGSPCTPVTTDADDLDDEYTTTAADVGRWMRAIVQLHNPGGGYASKQTTNATGVVAASGAAAPSATAAPAIAPAGSVTEGETLTRASDGAWDQSGLTFSYRWERCDAGCTAIPGAGGTSYATTAADTGKRVRLRVDARQGDGPIGSAVSPATTVNARPAPPAPVTPPADAAQRPAPVAGAPANPFGFTGRVLAVQDTTTTKPMPDVRGLQVDAAKAKIEAAGIHATFVVDEAVRSKPLTLPGKPRLDVGDVSAQSIAGGTSVTSTLGAPKAVKLTTEAGPKATASNGGPSGPACTGAAVRDDLKQLGLGEVLDLLRAKRCTRVEVDFTRSASAREVEVRKATKDGKDLLLSVTVPKDPKALDLTPVFRQGAFNGKPSFDERDWALTNDTMNIMGVQVVNRAGKTVTGAEVYLDARNVGTQDVDGVARGGIFVTGFEPRKEGLVNVLVAQSDAQGNRIFGFGQFKVRDRDGAFTGIDGKRYTASGTPTTAGARAAGLSELFAALGQLAKDLGAGIAKVFSGPVSEGTISTATKSNTGLAQLALGDVLSGRAGVVAAGGANVVAAGGANVVAAGGGNVIAAGGGNAISLAAGNVVAAGGGNLIGKDSIANGTGALIPLPAAVIAAGGGNVIAAGGGNVIAAGGGNVIAAGGGNVIAAGGGNVIAAGGGNVIAAGGGN